MKIYWRVEMRALNMTMHVTKDVMEGLGIKGAKDYYASRKAGEKYMQEYARKIASMGMSANIYLMSGTFE